MGGQFYYELRSEEHFSHNVCIVDEPEYITYDWQAYIGSEVNVLVVCLNANGSDDAIV